jgi:hypothetical protein
MERSKQTRGTLNRISQGDEQEASFASFLLKKSESGRAAVLSILKI